MKNIAYAMIGAGFLLAALVSVQESANTVSWGKYLPGFLLGGAGAVIARVSKRRRSMNADARGDDLQTLAETMARIVANIAELNSQRETLGTREVHSIIDHLFRSDLDAFAAARQSIGTEFGLEAYAAVMNEFAAGERYLNRVWSASVDGYVDEVQAYLIRAQDQFERTLKVLTDFTERHG